MNIVVVIDHHLNTHGAITRERGFFLLLFFFFSYD
ncbi:unnamed protein product [Spirodela intermedia]|uniref:Uncharacterized protein n=1 Tax=Spirodela intermedia TaxID=51605 RepID=A0A7I8JDQ0_SPIIN|nr:unnamed protein product [Spirodela intermedia]CAA6668131.1 unnamed protein product [Spirodela intermedia]